MMHEDMFKNGTSPLNQSFQDWDAGTPSDQVWLEVESSLSIDAVWNRLEESFLNEVPSDAFLKASFDEWTPASSHDGWSRMEEELARERVWTRLNKSLAQPILTAIPWLKMLAATIVLLFTAFPLSDMLQTTSVDGKLAISETMNSIPLNNKSVIAVEVGVDVKEISQATVSRENQSVDTEKLPETEKVIVANDVTNNEISKGESPMVVTHEYITELGQRGIFSDLDFIPATSRIPKVLFTRPTWAIQVGTQLSILPESDRSTFTNTVPNFGLAADISFNKYIGRFKLSQSIGISQYAQSNGKYINGRYLNTNQRLNTFQLTTTGGYEWNNTHFYGGVILSRLINGLEENQNVVTNVYNANKVQIGLTGGIDVNVKRFDSGSILAIGAQYQWIPTLSSSNVVFENIQGIRFQTKFSF